MTKCFKIFFFALLLVLPAASFAQDDDTDNKKPTSDCPDPDNEKALKLFKKYQDKKKYSYAERMKYLSDCLEEEPDYVEANFEMGRQTIIVQKNHDAGYKPAEPFYKKVIELCPNYHSDPYYWLGIIYWEDKNYDDCIKYMQLYLDFKSDDEKKYDKNFVAFQVDAKTLIRDSKNNKAVFGKKVPFDPQIVSGLSTTFSEYLPIITPDGAYAYYTRQQKPTSFSAVESDKMIEVFTESKKKKDGTWDAGYKMPMPFNQGNNEGGATVTIDNNEIFFTICKNEGGEQANCDIWTSQLKNGEWTPLKKLGDKVNDPKKWDSQPSVSSDGKTIYFASDRAGGFGGTDIWKTVRDASGNWGAPINLGPKINTSGDEKSPFIHSDSQTLYFSSGPDFVNNEGGLPGVGGLDIFYSKGNDKGVWQDPVNIGFPINSKKDDLGFFVSLDGATAYFASNDPGKVNNKTLGGWDIYSFELYKEARPEKVVFLEGTIEKKEGDSLVNTKVTLTNSKTMQTIDARLDTVTGKYRVIALNTGDDMILTVDKPGSAFTSQLVSIKDSVQVTDKPIMKVKTIAPQTIDVGKTYTLNNIYYKSGSADLDPKSKIVIDEFVKYMKDNASVKIEILSHTDNVGNDQDNLRLSKDRAYTVYEMLIAAGIDKTRITAFHGYGKDRPLVPNDNEANRAKNRRTEFLVVGK